MTKPVKLKCLRCGYEYTPDPSDDPETQERSCPRCRSNSVRILKEELRPADFLALEGGDDLGTPGSTAKDDVSP